MFHVVIWYPNVYQKDFKLLNLWMKSLKSWYRLKKLKIEKILKNWVPFQFGNYQTSSLNSESISYINFYSTSHPTLQFHLNLHIQSPSQHSNASFWWNFASLLFRKNARNGPVRNLLERKTLEIEFLVEDILVHNLWHIHWMDYRCSLHHSPRSWNEMLWVTRVPREIQRKIMENLGAKEFFTWKLQDAIWTDIFVGQLLGRSWGPFL